MTEYTMLLSTLDNIENLNQSVSLFESVPEEAVWPHVASIVQNQENVYRAIALLLSIESSFGTLRNRQSVIDAVLLSLDISVDDLVYEKAQRIVLRNFQYWQSGEIRKFLRKFEDGYQSNYRGPRLFIAELAIEGAILLPIFLGDSLKLAASIGLVRDEFPLLPDNRQAPAYLPLKVLKLLRYSFDVLNESEEIVRIFNDKLGSTNNTAVEAELAFSLGIVELRRAFQTDNSQALQDALQGAAKWFEQAQMLQENRTDAKLFLKINKLYIQLLYTSAVNPDNTISLIQDIQDIVVERFILNQARQLYNELSEFKLVNFLGALQQWLELLRGAPKWPDIKPPLSLLADIYASFYQSSFEHDFTGKAIKSAVDWIALPKLKSRFLEIQEIEAKLTDVLSDVAWCETVSQNKVEFYQYVLQEIKGTDPKAQTAAQWERLQAAVNQHDLTKRLWESITKDKSLQDLNPTDILLQILAKQRTLHQDINEPPNRQVREISEELLEQLHNYLEWETVSFKWYMLQQAVRLVMNYYYQLSIEDNTEDFRFLYAEDRGGLGQRAKEGDLQKHFYDAIRWQTNIKLEYEPKNVAVGRPDLLIRYKDDIRFPIEVKCETKDISRENIRDKYLSQAQEYAADSNQVSFLFVLDTTIKEIGNPKQYMADYCYVDSIRSDVGGRNNCVVILIFRANRFSPSVHSWESHKKPKK